MLTKRFKYNRRKNRARYKIKQTKSNRIRLCFYTSSKYIYGQIIDEQKKETITSLATYSKDFKDLGSKNNIEAAKLLGEKIAKVLLDKNLKDVYFDRGGRKYHGKTKAFAESARKSGLNF